MLTISGSRLWHVTVNQSECAINQGTMKEKLARSVGESSNEFV